MALVMGTRTPAFRAAGAPPRPCVSARPALNAGFLGNSGASSLATTSLTRIELPSYGSRTANRRVATMAAKGERRRERWVGAIDAPPHRPPHLPATAAAASACVLRTCVRLR